MATRKTAIRKMETDEVPTSAPLSDVERQELATASNAAPVEATKDGETASDRLPYPPRTKDGQEAYIALGQSIPSYLWVTRARALGRSMTADDVREIVAFDGPSEVVCTAPSGQCTYRFQPVRIAQVNLNHSEYPNGSLRTDERVVSESNPTGIAYRGAYLAVPVEPKNQHSKLRVLGPLCRRDQQALTASYKTAGWHVRSLDEAGATAFVAAVNTQKDADRAAWLARKDDNARALGLVTEDGQAVERGGNRGRGGFRNGPQRATAGGQNRPHDPRETNIGNRHQRVSESQ